MANFKSPFLGAGSRGTVGNNRADRVRITSDRSQIKFLLDTPDSFVGHAGETLIVSEDEWQLEFGLPLIHASDVIISPIIPGLDSTNVHDALIEIIDEIHTTEIFVFTAIYSGNASDIYLRGPDALPTNEGGFYIPFDATIVGIGVTTNESESWTAEVRKNGSATVIASLDITTATSGGTYTLDVDTDSGDIIQMYCNGTLVNKPTMTVYLKKR